MLDRVARALGIVAAMVVVTIASADARYLQTDPVGYEDDLNLYTYVKNDPLNLSDPTGRQSEILQMEREEEAAFRASLSETDRATYDAASYEANKTTMGIMAVGVATLTPIPGDEAVVASVVGGSALRSEVGRELLSTASEIAINAALDAAGPSSPSQPSGNGVSVEGIEAQARDPLAGTQTGTGDTSVQDRQTAAANSSVADRGDQGRGSPRQQRAGRGSTLVQILRAIGALRD